MAAGKGKPRCLKKELANRTAKIKMDWVSAKSPFKNMFDGCWPGRLSQGGLNKRAGEPKGENQNGPGVSEEPLEKHDRWMLAGEANPRGSGKRAGEPKGEN